MDSEKRFKQQTTCLYCENVLKTPRLLPCLHSFCSSCLKKSVKEDEDVICPTCSENHGAGKEGGITSIPKDVLGESLIYMGRTGEEKSETTSCSSCDAVMAEAVDRCLDCSEFLCPECSDIHRRLRQTRDHEVITLQEYDGIKENKEVIHRTLFCDSHPSEELRYFCEKCKEVMCRECTIVKHKNHKYVYIEESSTIKEVVQALEDLLLKMRSKVDKVKIAVDDVNVTADLITASISGLKTSVRVTAMETVRNIRIAEEEMITEIDRVQSRKFHGLNAQLKNLEINLEIFETAKFYAEHALKYLSKVELFQIKDEIGDRLKVLNKKRITHVPVEDNNLKHVRGTKKGHVVARGCLGSLEVNGNLVINGCVRDPFDAMDVSNSETSMAEISPQFQSIAVDIRGPGGESLYPLRTPKENGGDFGVDFQTERIGNHTVIVSLDGAPIQGSPLQINVCEPAVSPCYSSPSPPLSPESFGNNRHKPGGLQDVHGIATDNEGQIVATDTNCHQVKIFDTSGKFLHMFGSLGSKTLQFNSPHGIAVTKDGHLVIADTGNDRIQIFDNDCKFLKSIDCHDDQSESFHPYDVAIDHQNNIITLDREKSKVRIYNAEDKITQEFGSVGSGDYQFVSPSYITVNDSGHIIVSDMGNDRVHVLTSTGQLLFMFGRTGVGNRELRWPTGIAVKGNGDIVVSDSCNGRIQTFRADGSFVSCWEQSGDEKLKLPEGLTVDSDGAIIIADWGNNRIQILRPDKTMMNVGESR